MDCRTRTITATTDDATGTSFADWTTSPCGVPDTQNAKQQSEDACGEMSATAGLERLRILCRPTLSVRRAQRVRTSAELCLGAKYGGMTWTT